MVPETSFHRSVAVRILFEAVHACLTISERGSRRSGAGINPTFDGNILTAKQAGWVCRMKNYILRLEKAIRDLHGCESVHVSTTRISEFFRGKLVWGGEVETFTIANHPQASTCYAWAYPGDDGKQHYTAVLRMPPVDSPRSAIKAALVAQVKNETKET